MSEKIEKTESLGTIRDQLKVKTAECVASNAKVGTLMGQLLDAETKILVLTDTVSGQSKELETLRPIKEELDDKNRTVFSQGTNVVALKDKISLNKKQHQEELEHHGRVIDDLQKKLKTAENKVEILEEKLKSKKKRKLKDGE
jgi:predicted RNase H-like nuclease (RuvC/YqgF family)